jgi:HSP20 family protein
MEFPKVDPLKDMVSIRDEIDRLFDSFLGRTPTFRRTAEGEWSPVVDVQETPDEFIVIVEVPGMKKEDISISLTGDAISISGDKKRDDVGNITYHRLERSCGRFRRTISLPTEVTADEVNATYEDGLLTITLPKVEKKKPTEISIEVK